MITEIQAAELIETATEYAGSLEEEVDRIASNIDSVGHAGAADLRKLEAQLARIAAKLAKVTK